MKKLCTAGLLTGVLLLGSVGGVFADSRAEDVNKELGTKIQTIKLSELTKDSFAKLKKNIVKKGDIIQINLEGIDDKDIENLKIGENSAKLEQDFKDGKVSITVDENNTATVEYIDNSNK